MQQWTHFTDHACLKDHCRNYCMRQEAVGQDSLITETACTMHRHGVGWHLCNDAGSCNGITPVISTHNRLCFGTIPALQGTRFQNSSPLPVQLEPCGGTCSSKGCLSWHCSLAAAEGLPILSPSKASGGPVYLTACHNHLSDMVENRMENSN